MFSRSHLLIERDFEKLHKDKLWGIEAWPLKDENIFEWITKIHGLKGTAWEGGVFRLYLKFDQHYNLRPPQVCFHTIPFHPNVDMITGKPCLEFLDDWSQWKEQYSLSFLLLTIQSMLSSPVLENAVNSEAVNMILYSPHTYKQMVQDCVSASIRVAAGLLPVTTEADQHKAGLKHSSTHILQNDSSPPATAAKRKAKISFEDYHKTWTGIATSKSNNDAKNPLLEMIKDNPTLQAAHYGLPIQELQAQMHKQIEEHSQLLYGKFKPTSNKLTPDELKEAKLEKINQMRKIYLQPKSTPRRTPISLETTRQNTKVEEPWEEEVDDLVAWTNNLDADML